MTLHTRKQKGWIEPGIRRIVLPKSGETRFRVQLGTRTYRRSHLCKTYHEAQALKEEWTLRGLPTKDAPPISPEHDVVATVDDGFRHRVLDLEPQGKDSGERFAQRSALALLGVLRQADVRLLQRRQVRLAERLLLLPRTNGGKPRAVRLSGAAVTILRRALARQPQHDYVFANPRTGQP